MAPAATLYQKGAELVSAVGNLPLILQSERSECALACLAMVLGYYGHRIDINTLRSRHQISPHGIRIRSVINLASGLDLAVRPLRLDFADLRKLVLPAMLHWDLDHFVILKRVTPMYMEIHNPASGIQQISWKEAGKHFTGVALELIPTPDFKKKDERRKLPLGEMWKQTAGLAPAMLQLLVLSILLEAFAIALPFYTQILLDDVLVNYDIDLLKLLAAGFLLLTVFRQITDLLRAHVILYLSNKVSFHFATRLCSHLLRLPLDYFSRRHIGDIVSRFGSLNNVRDFLCSGIIQVFIDALMVLGTLILMFVYSKSLTAIALTGVIIYGFIRAGTYKRFHQENEQWIHDRATENTVFMENINAIQGIKLFNREASRLGSWQNSYAAAINSGIKVQKLGITVQFFHGLLIGLENILLLLVGCFSVLSGTLSIGMLMAFISFKDNFYRSIFSLLDKLFEFRLLDIHLDRLADIAFTAPEIKSLAPSIKNRTDEPCVITLDDLAYRYCEDTAPLFENVCLQIEQNEKVAIVGPTGCGKSTLLKLVLSLIEPMQGRVLFNGKSISQHGLENYRTLVSGVLQNDSLLSGSIMENITFFDPAPDLERVRISARQAMLEDEIALMPMQFNTGVGNMGNALSGGQIQRILLARALYQKPSLLVLDEATSHLDVNTERAVNASLSKLNIPCLLVAHRPQTVLCADRIFLLSAGGLQALSHENATKVMSTQPENDVITT